MTLFGRVVCFDGVVGNAVGEVVVVAAVVVSAISMLSGHVRLTFL